MFRGFHNFEIFNNLWQTIQDCVASAPGAPFQRHKTWLLLEHPGFAIDADCYNPELYRRSFAKLSSRPSPEYLIAQLCDRVPALAHNFFDTGDRISLKWKQLLSTFSHHPSHDHDDPQLKERYEKAINALYVDFEEQRKSDLYLKASFSSCIIPVLRPYSDFACNLWLAFRNFPTRGLAKVLFSDEDL